LTHEQGLALERRGEPRYALNNPSCYVLGFSAVNGDIQIDSPV
jgi:hypothetical protein